ncbi:sialoadhesin-like isoform X1 [Labeo rohita]|uniref:Sialoadhesin-like isoform X1 n=1 Tax=Labeo rohita TaxID=84645 RepID=A0A498MNK8_LABRO|nr:sialoadhesin-like isoform X1 [Labeo rohita]
MWLSDFFVTLDQLSVTCSEESICAVKGTEVTLTCFYSNNNIKTVFWFSEKQSTNWRKNNESEDLTLDSDYSGRVKHQISSSSSTLTISDVRERDSGEYQLMFIMNDGVKHLSSAAVSLTVTDLQLRMNPVYKDLADESVQLTCDTSCTFTSGVWYYWMKDGQHFTYTQSSNIFVSHSRNAGSFSCSLYSDDSRPSSSVCVSQSGCWDVTYTSRRVCALVNSTVDISCTYSHPSGHTVNKTFWHYGPSGVFKDLREEHQFAGRVEYVENKLRIKDLKISDSGEYRFRIITDLDQYAGSPGVILTVTGMQTERSPAAVSEEEDVILSCSTKCTLNDNPTYIWYKNGRQVTDGFTKVNKLYLDSVSNEELQQYSCAVGDPVNSTVFSHYTVTLLLFLPQFLIIAALWMWKSSSVTFIVCVNLHKVKIMNSRLSALILLLLIPVFVTLDQLSVTCSEESICAVKGTEVTLTCFYSNNNIKTVFWFSEKQSTNWRKNNESEDLTLDSDYSGRVKHQISSSSSTLTISDVRERDSGEYQLMFIMNDGVKHLSSAAVSLTVTDLQLRMNPVYKDLADESVQLTCDTSCTFTSGVWYYWMKDGQHFTYTQSSNIFVSHSRNAGSFSCSLYSDDSRPSSSVCVSQSGCWDVTYTSRRVCALVNSTVDISCTYSHPSGHTVNKTFWHYGPSGVFKDLREEHQFAGRVEYVENKLRIKDLKISDSGEYRFRIITDLDQYAGSPGVILTVTGMQTERSPAAVSEEEDVILSCSTKCTLNDNPTYIWYKNGRQVTDGFTKVNKLYLDSVSNEELQQYSCAVGDPASPESSTALLITVIILSALLILTLIGVLWYRRRKNSLSQKHEDTMESEQSGSDMLYENAAGLSTVCTQQVHTANCTLNDKHTYIWYKNGRQVTDGFTKVNKLYLDSVSNEELQQYSCAVGDAVGNTVFSHYTVTLLLFLPQFLIIVALWIWKSSSVSFIVCVNLHKVKIMNSRLSALILLLLIQGSVTFDRLSVTCSQKSICAVKGSEVTLKCSYSNINIKTVFWFSEKQSTNWRKNNEPEDLTLDSDYSGRVKHQISSSSSTLTISDVRERDSGEYQLMFIMNDGVKHLSSAAVSLTVTGRSALCLSLYVNLHKVKIMNSRLSALILLLLIPGRSALCLSLYVNLHKVKIMNSRLSALILLLLIPGSVTFDRLSVTCSQKSICAVKGSEVTLTCSYSNINIKTVFWFSEKQSTNWRKNNEPEDLTLDSDYSGRVKHQISSSSSTLTISDVRERDSGEYQLMFIMNDAVKHLSSAAVSLTVTGTQMKRSPAAVSEGQEVILSCSTSCTLNDNHTYIWYKNGRQVTDGFTKVNKLYLDSVSNEELQQYSCAVGAFEDPANPESSTALLITVIILSVLLIITLMGVLWYRSISSVSFIVCVNLHKVKIMNSRLSALILLLLIQGFVTLDQLSVTCSQESICAVKGTEVTLKCSYSNINIKTVFWFSEKQSTNWRKNNEPEDLTLDSDYSGRVKHQISSSSSTLTISDVRERDSGEYQLMFIMNDGVKHLSSAAVSLTVTDLQVKMYPVSTGPTDKRTKLTCATSCTSGVWYFWMKDGQHFTYTQDPNIFVSHSRNAGSFSCSLYSDHRHPSSSVCVSQSVCWDVTYTSRRVCALVNSTVDISCTYSHPSDHTVNKTFWHYGPSWDFKDLREEHQFAGRVEYVGNKLRIKDLKISTQINSSTSVVSEKDKVILSCSTNCTLKDKHTYIWYKNGRQVTDGFTKVNKLYLDSVSNEELQQYSCAVGDPVNSTVFSHYTVTLLLFLPQFLIIAALWMCQESICAVKGTEVTLKCFYSNINIKTVFWFSEKQSTNWRKNNEPEDLTLDSDYSGRVKHQISSSSSTLTISDVRERDSGEYQLMFIMNDGVKHLSSAAVSLTVTDLQVRINPVSTDLTDERVQLTCDSSCTLTSGGHYYWMKNGRHFKYTQSSNMFVSISRDAGSFSCSHDQNLKHRSSSVCVSQRGCWDVTYTSTRVCALMKRSPAAVSEGQEVILSCSTNCTLNDNHTYIWYKNGRQVTDGFTKVNKLYLDSVSNEDLQQYSCAVGGRERIIHLNSMKTQWRVNRSISSVSFIVCVNLHKVKIMNSRLSALILLLLIPGFVTLDRLSMICNQKIICAVKGSEVTLKCLYSNINIKTVFWFSEKQNTNWRKNNEPEDLTLDSDYSGRVKHQISSSSSTLTISDVRERDSGEYQLMFIMNDGVKHLSSAAVSLTVTDLQVKMNPVSTDPTDESVQLTCDSSCTLTSAVRYYWMKDGQYFTDTQSPDIFVSHSRNAGSFSCSLYSDHRHPSSSVCVSQSGCWDVTYTSTRVCALVNSTVDISCTYSHPSAYTVYKTFWHYSPSGVFKDLREEHQFAGRVEYVGNKLRIKDLKISDSGEYRFRIISKTTRGRYSGSPGVILTVTGTQINSSPSVVSEGQEVILSCSTNCTLNDNTSYIWYKNRRQVTDGFTKVNKLYLDSVSNEELQQYSCAVGDPVNSTVFSHYTVTLLVFLPQFLIIAALWMWSISSVSFNVCVNLHKVKIMNSRLSALILLLLIPGFVTLDQLSVTCSQESICAVKGTEVTLKCFYSNNNIKTVFWFSEKQSTNWRKNNESEDLTLDSDYSGRVKHQISSSSSTLTISDVRERDSGEYQLMFIMNDGVKHLRSAAVSLTVTDLQLKMNPVPKDPTDERVQLTCDTSCTLTSGVWYYWMKDGQHFTHTQDPNILVSHSDAGSFSVSLRSDHRHPSSSVCTQINSSTSVVSEGQEVILSCSTNCTLNDNTSYIWYKNGRQVTDGFTKVNKLYLDSVSNEELQQYSCAVGDTTSPESSTALLITVIILSVLLIITLIGVLWYRENIHRDFRPLLILLLHFSVLQVRMNPVSTDPRDQRVKLTCDTSCDLTPGGWYYYWMKNGQLFTETQSPNMFVPHSRDAESFSCYLGEHKHLSSSMCLSQSGCWDVTYTSRRVCALVGSTVDISCTYSHSFGHTVNKTFWHYSQNGVFKDLHEKHQFAGRVEYVGNKLRIKDLKISDSGEYRFRIISNTTTGRYSGSPGVILTVTVFSHYTVTLLVFLPQFLIIAALWMWFFFRISFQNKIKNKNEEILMFQMSSSTSAFCPSELLE